MRRYVTLVRNLKLCLTLGLFFAAPLVRDATAADAAGSYYTVKPLFNPYPGGGGRYRDWEIRNFGPVGIGVTLKKPLFTMVISNVEKGSPADATRKLKKGQIIESINGALLKDRDPRVILGDIITKAEATDGVITLKVKDLGDVVVNIPAVGSYSKTWPLDCPKSDKIVRNLAGLLAKQESPSWGSALFLLSTGDEQDLAVVKTWLSGRDTIGSYPWHAGYLGIAYCEYYLRTGDESVLPAIQKMGERLKETMYNGGWSGRGDGASFTYSTGTGQMHAAGVHCVTFLMLAKMCGVELDDYMLQESLKTFYRFAGHENVPYGDGWPEGGFRDNGKSGGLAVAMAAAARLTPEGEASTYAKARDHVGMKSFYATSWFHSAHTGGGIGEIWHNASMSMLQQRRPVQHRSFLDTRRWVMELSRRHDGGIGIAGVSDRYDRSASEQERSWGNYLALTYTIPRRKLIVFGAPKTPWCKSFQLPDRPWGRPADDAFVRTEPTTSAAITMEDVLKEQVPTDASLAVSGRLGSPDVTDRTLLKYLLHPEMGYRTAAMRSAVNNGHDKFVLPLLKSKDPRQRHAGLLAITGMFKGRAFSDDKLTPEMFEWVGNMIEDPNESLWVVQQALKAIRRAKPEVVAQHRDSILEYMKHDDWFLRASAIEALVPICAHPDHYKAIMPLMFKTLAQFTTDQALTPVWSLKKLLAQATPGVKAFAMQELQKAYAGVPTVMSFPGGRVMGNGSQVVRSRISAMMSGLPGGDRFIKTMPKMTTAAARSGNAIDKYCYSGTFAPNTRVMGTWHWAVWPRPKHEGEVETRATSWVEGLKKGRKEKPKDVLTLSEGGSVKSGQFKGYFWSDHMLIGTDVGVARKMEVRNIAGTDFLIIESGGFDPETVPSSWDQKYTIYMRAK
jgi:hypothetical protein